MSGQGGIGKRIAILHEIGFADPLTMAQKNQAILTYTPDAILAKIAEMRELGFSDPVQMITSNPTLLSYSLRNIRAKIENLREFGFDDPVKLITSLRHRQYLRKDSAHVLLKGLRRK